MNQQSYGDSCRDWRKCGVMDKQWQEFIKNSECYINYHRKIGDYKEADRERDWLRQQGFEVQITKLGTKIWWKKK